MTIRTKAYANSVMAKASELQRTWRWLNFPIVPAKINTEARMTVLLR